MSEEPEDEVYIQINKKDLTELTFQLRAWRKECLELRRQLRHKEGHLRTVEDIAPRKR